MPIDERLAARLRDLFGRRAGSSERRMFGGICFMVDEKMCCGVSGSNLVVRVGAERMAQALRRPHVRPMDFTGRPLRGFVYVSPEGYRTARDLRRWVDHAVRFAATLPAKPTKARHTKRTATKPASRRSPAARPR